MLPTAIKEYVEYRFVYESVSIDAIASFAYGEALSPDGGDVCQSDMDWFRAWAKKQLRHEHDIAAKATIWFLRFDVYQANVGTDVPTFVVEGTWQHWNKGR
jgi:hypothetical protein